MSPLRWLALLLLAAPWLPAQSFAVFRTNDLGRTWVPSGAGLRPDSRINAFAAVGSQLLAATDRGVYYSQDRGARWTLAGETRDRRYLSLAALGDAAYAGGDTGELLASLDGGHRWTARVTPFRKLRALAVLDGHLYAGTDNQGVHVSRDGGLTWQPAGAGLPAHAQVFALAVARGRLFAALYSRGLYALSAGTWSKAGTVQPLVLVAAGGALIAGHNPGGLFRSEDAGATWTPLALPGDVGRAPVWEAAAGPWLVLAGVAAGIYVSQDGGRKWYLSSRGLPARSSGVAFLAQQDVALAAVTVSR